MKTYQKLLMCLAMSLLGVSLLGIAVTVVASSEPTQAAVTTMSTGGTTGVQPIVPASLDGTSALNPNAPSEVVKLVFIHHSSGTNWLNDGNGGLGEELGDNNYYVSDVSYGWGTACPGCSGCDSWFIGSCTDIGHWWEWFRGSNSTTYLGALYGTTNKYATYTRPMADPGGENEIIMFKSCFPNSNLRGNPDAPPTTGSNPLRGQPWDAQVGGEYVHTVANAKGIYNDILEYFATRQDKLFVVITAPPMLETVTTSEQAANARAFNRWLVNDWLAAYPHNNVAVFDFYNVLTSNGGDRNTNDLGWETGNHHRYRNGVIEYITDQGSNYGQYGSGDSDPHPTAAGNQKATGEFVPLLNIYYNCWKHGDCEGGSPVPTNTPTATSTQTAATPTATSIPTPSYCAFQESGGQVVIEAENYFDTVARDGHNWELHTSYSDYSGSGYMQALPDEGTTNNTGYTTHSPELQYKVNFQTTGWYYVWIRGRSVSGSSGASDSVHAGLDGQGLSTSDRINGFSTAWAWHKDTMDGSSAYFDVSTTGEHTLNIWMREDGFAIDKIILTTTSDSPSGQGPDEDDCVPVYGPTPDPTKLYLPLILKE